MPKIPYEDNPKSIKFYVKRFLLNEKERFRGKKVIDFPAGNGITSRILKEIGAEPLAYDLFPEYFQIEGLKCKRANIVEGLPLEDATGDALICQEGIEHFSDQFGAFKEFNRLIKLGGTLLITTPNYSSIKSKISYFLSESERFHSRMPPNELDSVWMTDQAITDEIYFGHIFLIGIQRLRVLAKLAGFRIVKFHFTRPKTNSLLLFPLVYPFIYLSNWYTYRKNMRKKKQYDLETRKKVYGEVFKWSVHPKILFASNLMVEFEKEKEIREVAKELQSKHSGFEIDQ